MIRNKKVVCGIILLIVLLLPLVLFFTQCSSPEIRRASATDVVSVSDLMFFMDIGFVPRNRPDPTIPFTRLELVLCKEEAYALPNDLLVFWAYDFVLERVVGRLNLEVVRTEQDLLDPNTGELVRDVLTLEQFGLSYPLTVDDLIDNWENVADLWFSLDRETEHLAVRAGGR